MNNELFDKILKTELDKTVVTPSASVTKAVGSKLFLQNLLVFHKIKIAIAAILGIVGKRVEIASYTNNITKLKTNILNYYYSYHYYYYYYYYNYYNHYNY